MSGAPGNANDQPPAPRARRAGRALVIAVLALLLGVDLARAPERQVTARLLVAGIHLYQAGVSPGLKAVGVRCRFEPTCSHYAEGAIGKYGALVGSWRAAKRILRCGPWTPAGTVDPP